MDKATNGLTFKGETRRFPVTFNGQTGKTSLKFRDSSTMEVFCYFDQMYKNYVYFAFLDETGDCLKYNHVYNPGLYYALIRKVDTIVLLSLIFKVLHRFPVNIPYDIVLETIPEVLELEKLLGVEFKDKKILLSALIHPTFTEENQRFIEQLNLVDNNNQRLENLGDSVLGMTISKFAYDHFLSFNEGSLSTFKHLLVKNKFITEIADKLKLDRYLLKGNGEYKSIDGKDKRLADVFEAIVAAIFVDAGYDQAKDFILRHCSEIIEEFLTMDVDSIKEYIEEQNPTGKFNDMYQYLYGIDPVYDCEMISTNPPLFSCTIYLDDIPFTGLGRNKKLAKKEAAKKGIDFLKSNYWQYFS